MIYVEHQCASLHYCYSSSKCLRPTPHALVIVSLRGPSPPLSEGGTLKMKMSYHIWILDFSPPAPFANKECALVAVTYISKWTVSPLPNLVRNWPSVRCSTVEVYGKQQRIHLQYTHDDAFRFSEERAWGLNPPMRGQENMTDSRRSQWNINAPSLKLASVWRTRNHSLDYPRCKITKTTHNWYNTHSPHH